jgi:hypothetical protein
MLSTIFAGIKKKLIVHFEKWLRHNPRPEACLTDQGRNYIEQEFELYLSKKNIKHLKTTPYNPTENSISERLN